MNSNELVKEFRIGNWYNQFGNYHQVDWVTIKELSSSPTTQRWCKPIPLSEGILLKCGFELDELLYLKVNDCIDIVWIGYLAIEVNGVIISIGDYTYLHQLQNLYFALTNQELKINL